MRNLLAIAALFCAAGFIGGLAVGAGVLVGLGIQLLF